MKAPYKIRKRRNTIQRRKTLQIVQKSNTHATAEAIYERLHVEMPEISLSTVYRNLKALADEGLVSVTDLGDGLVFEAVEEHAHHHLVCLNCKKVIPLEHMYVEPLFNQIEKQGFKLVTSHLALYGYCKECQSKESE
ncbi:MAG: Fur family transcriptional regulator [Anaerolineales bacterium]|jgi:Fur family ferric uptake transcriptional regulator